MKRKSDELFYDYQARRLMQNQELKQYLKGSLVWNSKKQGPFVNPKRLQKKINRDFKNGKL